MDLEVGAHSNVTFTNPDVVQYAQSFGAHGYRIESADQLLPTLQKALADGGVSIIAVPVDYSENLRLTSRLGDLDEAI
jgi:acetolactate synthase-1/2/3 large subunit